MADNPLLKTQPFGEPINEIFEDFIEKTLLNQNSYLEITTDITKPIFTEDNMKSLVNAYVKKYDDGDGTFYEKLKKQIEGELTDEQKAVFANLLWLKFLFQEKKIDKQPSQNGVGGECGRDTINKIKECTIGFNEEFFPSNNGCAPYGMATINVDAEMTDLVLLYYQLLKQKFNGTTDEEKKNAINAIKKYIIFWCLDIKDDGTVPEKGEVGIRSATYNDNVLDLPEERKCPKTLLPLHNMLLYACNPDYYDNIAVSGDKEKIAKAFKGIWTKADIIGLNGSKADFYDNADENNKIINIIYSKLNNNGNNPQLYFEPYRSMWRNEGTELDAIKFKKALVLYGPPGTSKTYTAKEMAKTIIRELNYASKIDEYIKDLGNGEIEKRIHRLQLHPNYTYEDFVWGYQIENEKYDQVGNSFVAGKTLQCVGNKTTPRKGYFLRLLDELNKDNGKIHVLILDEINRVDLSRLFGELFSAIENRDEAIDLPVVIEGLATKMVLGQKVSQISIPQNLYIIGTMNEIDFSLERVDFALRRRFIWKYYGFNQDALGSIIEQKKSVYSWPKPEEEDIVNYVNRCKALNAEIANDPDLGGQFEIGHTFFGEIVDIWATKAKNTQLKKVQETLWEISIGPMVEAYLGNCDAETKKNKLESFKVKFIPELKKNDGKTTEE